MDTSYVEYESDDCRSSTESSVGFSFASAMDLRKNLAEAFDKQANKTSISTMSCTSVSTLSVTDRIAQFEKAAQTARPPLPLREQSNTIPTNRLAVYLRIRPPVSEKNNPKGQTTKEPAEQSTIEVLKPQHPNIHPTSVRTYPPPQSNTSKINSHREGHDACAKEFKFHQVLEPETTQKALYSTVAAPLVRSLFDATLSSERANKTAGESALLFSYGITNAGKTHTILGNMKSSNDANWGVIPRAICDIFDRMKQLPKDGGSFDLYLSYFEIYNEQIYDLIPQNPMKQKMMLPPALKIREHQGQTIVRGLAKHKVRDINHGIELTSIANNKRYTSSNNLNAGSSRSHCVCQMQIIPRSNHVAAATSKKSEDDSSVISLSGYSTDEEASLFSRQKTSTLWIVDLAGSERSKRTGLGSTQQKEASQINKSLMTLTRCLSVMRESGKNNSSQIVPFRESKLTHVFMSHLTGSSASRTAMIVNVNPTVSDFDETQHVLAYASQAKKIEIRAEELSRKRKQYFGNEYGMDGRKKFKPVSSTAAGTTKRLLKMVAKKLSPKKVAKKLSPKKIFHSKGEKRKAASKELDKSSSANLIEPIQKRVKYPPEKQTIVLKSSEQEEEILALKMALNVAQSEVQTLRSAKADLEEELRQKETQIRMEVSQEMEDRLRASRERNNLELARLRDQINSNPLPSRSSHKVQMDNTDKQIEELMDKVEECEEEMVRMRQEHEEQVKKLKSELDVAITMNQGHFVSNASDSKKVTELEKELAATRSHMERLEKSKIEIVETYEKLLREAADDEEEEEEDEESPEEQVPFWKHRILRSKASAAEANSLARRPLGTISGNIMDTAKEKWIFPKKPSSKNELWVYRRPAGRAPHGRAWDASVGAWKLHT